MIFLFQVRQLWLKQSAKRTTVREYFVSASDGVLGTKKGLT